MKSSNAFAKPSACQCTIWGRLLNALTGPTYKQQLASPARLFQRPRPLA